MKKPLLQRLSEEERDLLLSHSTPFHIKEGSDVFMEGDMADRIFFIKSGVIRVHKLITEGKEITIFLRGKDDCFGEIGPFSGRTYSCTARAETDCELYYIDQHKIESLLAVHAPITLEFLKWAAESLETSSSKIKDYLMFNSHGAVASVLIRLSKRSGVHVSGGVLIDEVMTNYDIAAHIGSTRETVNRVINNMKSKGVITMDRKSILIKDMDYLTNLMGCDKCGVQNCVL